MGSHLWIQATSISTTSISTPPPATKTPPLAKAWKDPPQKPRPKIDKKLTPAAARSPARQSTNVPAKQSLEQWWSIFKTTAPPPMHLLQPAPPPSAQHPSTPPPMHLLSTTS